MRKLPRIPSFIRPEPDSVSLPPGSLTYVGKDYATPIQITVVNYDKTLFRAESYQSAEEALNAVDLDTQTWFLVNGLQEVDTIARIGEHFKVHPLILEDVLNTRQRPKSESFNDYTFLATKELFLEDNGDLGQMQVSFVLGTNWLLVFTERQTPIFDAFIRRLQAGSSKVRQHEADFLFYRLTDIIVDEYLMTTTQMTERILLLEEEVLESNSEILLKEIQKIRKQLIRMRRVTGPMDEAVLMLLRHEVDRTFKKTTQRYFSDVSDHLKQVSEGIEAQRDLVASIMDVYMTNLNNRTNKVMQLLTIIATIFIPLTFIAGVYGMNFEHMPELSWKYSYPVVWGVMLATAILLVVFFWRKRWL